MTATQPMPYRRLLTGLIVGCLATICFSAPLRRQTPKIRPLHLDDMRTYTRLVLNTINFGQTNLSLELNKTKFPDLVCPLFGIYSRMQQTLQSLSDDDERNNSVSVATFILERQTVMICDYVKANCTEDQQCANMSCDMSSIAETCLHMNPPVDRVRALMWGEDTHQDRHHQHMIPLWLGQLLSDGHPNVSTLAAIQAGVERQGAVKCTIPEYGSDAMIKCPDDFTLFT